MPEIVTGTWVGGDKIIVTKIPSFIHEEDKDID